VKQRVSLTEVPQGAKQVRWWISIPDDDRAQDLLDVEIVSAPGQWSVQRDPQNGNRFLFVEVSAPKSDTLDVALEFTLRRRPLTAAIDPTKVGPLTAADRVFFSDELNVDAPHMVVTGEIRAMADRVCGDTRNLSVEALKLLRHVASVADHDSKDPTKPKCGVGDAEDCLENSGGCCTDLHSLFIALARARGIPTRLQMGYRLLAKNEGKEVDPGYRCWPEYFVPGYGWVAADIVESDAVEGAESLGWLTGLSERRLWLDEGREFELMGATAKSVNTMIIGHAEIDGVTARVLPDGEQQPQLFRKVWFEEVMPGEPTTVGAPSSK
jgi:transglutaminase-like putative cysteine protease